MGEVAPPGTGDAGSAPQAGPNGKAARPAKPEEIEIENQTARRIRIRRAHGKAEPVLALAPFGVRRLPKGREKDFDLEPWINQDYVRVVEPCDHSETVAFEASTLLGMFFIAAVGIAVAAWRHTWIIAVAAIGVLAAVAIPEAQRWNEQRKRRGAPSFDTQLWRAVGMFLVCLVGYGLPLVAVFVQSGKSFDNVAHTARSSIFSVDNEARGCFFLALFGLFVGTAATLPALLFFILSEQRKNVAKVQFFREVLRLDPSLRTIGEAERSYQPLITDVFDARRGALFFSPVLLSTFLLTLGWTITALPTAKSILQPLANGQLELNALFIPNRTAFAFGFLGSYFFAVNMAFRRYVRADLGPKAYSHISVRIIIASILAWVFSQLPGTVLAGGLMVGSEAAPAETVPWFLLLLVFFVGIVPDTGLAVMHDLLKSRVFSRFIVSLENRDPLSRLEGITLYDRARLLEEGIENVENLAHHNLIDLILRTRIPTPRLVDLVDQAVLYLHARDGAGGAGASGGEDAGGGGRADPAASNGKGRDEAATTLRALRGLGIRTATDLELAAGGDPDDAGADAGGVDAMPSLVAARRAEISEAAYRKAFFDVLGPATGEPKRLQVILRAMHDDEWMPQLRSWRRFRHTYDRAYQLSAEEEMVHAPWPPPANGAEPGTGASSPSAAGLSVRAH